MDRDRLISVIPSWSLHCYTDTVYTVPTDSLYSPLALECLLRSMSDIKFGRLLKMLHRNMVWTNMLRRLLLWLINNLQNSLLDSYSISYWRAQLSAWLRAFLILYLRAAREGHDWKSCATGFVLYFTKSFCAMAHSGFVQSFASRNSNFVTDLTLRLT